MTQAFIYFWLFALIGGVIVVCIVYILTPLLKAVVFAISKNHPKDRYSKDKLLLKLKHIKYLSFIYIFSIAIFFIVQVNTYLLNKRPHKEAKAWAIVGEYIMLWQQIYVNYKTIDTYPALILENIQKNIVLRNIYKYIPKDDGEREIWRYKFYLWAYARSMYAPIDKKAGLRFSHPGASFTPQILPLIKDMYDTMEALHKKSIKDKEFDRLYRYISIVSMAPYYRMYAESESNINLLDDGYDGWRKAAQARFKSFFTSQHYKKRFEHFLDILDDTKKAWGKDKELADLFESMPHIKIAFYWASVTGYSSLVQSMAVFEKKHPCNTKKMKYYSKYYNELMTWAFSPRRTSFKSFSKKRQRSYLSISEGSNATYYVAKYICKEKFDYLNRDEESTMKLLHLKTKKELNKEMKRMHEDEEKNGLAQKVRKLQIQKGINNGQN